MPSTTNSESLNPGSSKPVISYQSDQYIECPDFSAVSVPINDFRAAYFTSRDERQTEAPKEDLKPVPEKDDRAVNDKVAASASPLKGVGEYRTTRASISLLNETMRAADDANLPGVAGRLALGLTPLAITGIGFVTTAAGGLVALGSFGLAALGYAVIDGGAYSMGIMGMCSGALVGVAGYGVMMIGEWGCHQVRRLFDDTEVSFLEALPKES